MGVNLRGVAKAHAIDIKCLSGKKLAVDAYNQLYQFLTTIRSRDGTPLKDSEGNITSHLTGLFTRALSLMQNNVKLCYVFDGQVPDLKRHELQNRKQAKVEAEKSYIQAKEEGDEELMRKYAARFSRLTDDMVEESKKLIIALGMPVIQAPAEGEAQAAFMTKHDDVYAVASQDFDSLLFAAKRVVRNLSVTQKKKIPGKISYQTVKPEEIRTKEVLEDLGISQEQLICLAMLVGTDYNPGGIKGLGPKKALKLVKAEKNPEKIFSKAKWDENFEVRWNEIFELFTDMPVNKDYVLEWNDIHEEKVIKLLVDKHDFSQERVEGAIAKAIKRDKSQQGLKKWF